MKTRISLLVAICLVGTAFAQPSEPLPKPGPGHQKMLQWCGQYDIAGKTYTTPLGPGRAIKGKWIGRPILDGFAIEGVYVYEGKGPTGETQAKEIVSYDPATDKYHYLFLSNNGYVEQAPFTVEGAVAAWEGTQVIDGKEYQFRGSDTYLPDGSGFVRKGELSADGKTWQPIIECRHIKVETTGDEQELTKLEKEAWNAATKGDIETMDRILADEFIGIYDDTGDDPVWTKEFLISVLKSGRYVLTSIEYDDVKVRVNGRAAAMTGIATTKESFDGQDLSGRFRFTSTWIKGPSGWQCVGDHAVRISDSASNASDEAESERNKAVMHRVFDDVFNGRNVDAVDEIYHKDFVSHTFGYPDSTGVEAHKRMVAGVYKSIPDYHEHLHEMVVEGDLAACRWTSTGTFSGAGATLNAPCLSLYRFQDGKIIEQWLSFGERPQELVNKALVRRALEEIPAGDWEAASKLHSPDFVYHWSDDPNTLTLEEVGQMVGELTVAIPDLKRTTKDIFAEGDRVALRMVFEGTHLGEYEGIPPTGKAVKFQTIAVIRVVDGKIVEAWEDGDNIRFMQQFGVNLLDKP